MLGLGAERIRAECCNAVDFKQKGIFEISS